VLIVSGGRAGVGSPRRTAAWSRELLENLETLVGRGGVQILYNAPTVSS